MAGTWKGGWVDGDPLTAGQLDVGCVFDQTLSSSAVFIDTGANAFPTVDPGHLLVIVQARSDAVLMTDALVLQMNADTSGNYDTQEVLAAGTAVTATEQLLATGDGVGSKMPAANAPATVFGAIKIMIPAYAGTTAQKSIITQWAGKSGTASGNIYVGKTAAFWRSTAAITRLAIRSGSGSNLVAGSRMSVYVLGGTP